MTGNNELENGTDPQGRQTEQVERSEAEFHTRDNRQDDCLYTQTIVYSNLNPPHNLTGGF